MSGGIDYIKWIADLSLVLKNVDKNTARHVTDIYIEHVKTGRDLTFGNTLLKFNRTPLQDALEFMFTEVVIHQSCPNCYEDVLSNGLIGFWAGAELDGIYLPNDAIRLLSNYVIPGTSEQLRSVVLSPSILVIDLIGIFKRNLESMTGIMTIEVKNGTLQVFTWKGFS